jgi:hypothetical protein
VAEGVAGDALREACLHAGAFYRALERGFVEVVAEAAAGRGIRADAGRGEDPLPRPFPGRVRELAVERARERRSAEAAREIALVQALHPLEMAPQWHDGDARQRRRAIAIPLALTHDELLPLEVHVLDA